MGGIIIKLVIIILILMLGMNGATSLLTVDSTIGNILGLLLGAITVWVSIELMYKLINNKKK